MSERGVSVLVNDGCSNCPGRDMHLTTTWDGAEIEWWCLACGFTNHLPITWVREVVVEPYQQASA